MYNNFKKFRTAIRVEIFMTVASVKFFYFNFFLAR